MQSPRKLITATLKLGWVKIEGGDGNEPLFERGGFADVSPDCFTILADYAVPESELNASYLDKYIKDAEKAAGEAVSDEAKRLALEHRDQLREFKATLGTSALPVRVKRLACKMTAPA